MGDKPALSSDKEWIDRVVDAMRAPRDAVIATDFMGEYDSYSKAVALTCSDGLAYIVKARHVVERGHLVHMPRAMFTDQVVGLLGAAMDAPVGRVALVDLPFELVTDEPRLRHLRAGLAHGCKFLEGVHDGWPGVVENLEGNRARFAKLAVLYGWFEAADHQFLYSDSAPFHVYSVDHGHFLPGGPEWSRKSLRRALHVAPDAQIIGAVQMGSALRKELSNAAADLDGINDAVIVRAVAAPPESWGVGVPERVALAQYLCERRTQLLEALR